MTMRHLTGEASEVYQFNDQSLAQALSEVSLFIAVEESRHSVCRIVTNYTYNENTDDYEHEIYVYVARTPV